MFSIFLKPVENGGNSDEWYTNKDCNNRKGIHGTPLE